MSLASQPYSYEYQYNDGTGNKPFDEQIVIGGAVMWDFLKIIKI